MFSKMKPPEHVPSSEGAGMWRLFRRPDNKQDSVNVKQLRGEVLALEVIIHIYIYEYISYMCKIYCIFIYIGPYIVDMVGLIFI